MMTAYSLMWASFRKIDGPAVYAFEGNTSDSAARRNCLADSRLLDMVRRLSHKQADVMPRFRPLARHSPHASAHVVKHNFI
jgi:hypothetical protein